MSQLAILDDVLNGLMRRYKERVPDVQAILDCMVENKLIQNESDIENDHIAFRTLGVPHLGIRSLEKIFLHLGYAKKDAYSFPAKKLNAFWYAPPQPKYPRIFISELRVKDLSAAAQEAILKYTREVTSDPVDQLDLNDSQAIVDYLHQSLWRTPTWKDYSLLADESEYAAWAIFNRYYLNHFTVSVHNLPESYRTIAQFNAFIESHGFKLNDAGGKAKTSQDGLLIQSSTVARLVEAEFEDEDGKMVTKSIPGSYVEFAERKVVPEFEHLKREHTYREHRRDGFEAANADKIFESTYSEQIEKARD
ncbi:MAG: DUF1338 domain-containing protein [Acidobacteria bacterium]|nr:MAG: DUF1338 domain-containing protein [Acidobacteriota bacterium]